MFARQKQQATQENRPPDSVFQQTSGKSSMQGRTRGAMFDAASKAPSAPLPHRAKMEDRFGQDFSSVRARMGGPDVETALVSQGASAAARGEEVLFASANPSEEEVAHELTHVVQAREGRATASPEGEAEAQACATGDCGTCTECNEAHESGAATGNTEQVAFNDGDDRCTELIKLIEQCLNGGGSIKRGLRERWDDLVEDRQGLQWEYWSTPHPKYGSIEGHQKQFRDLQRRLRNLLDEYNTKGCGGGGGGLPDGVWEWATREAPSPRPRENPNASRDISWGKVADVVMALGLSVALIGLILWAVLSPDPLGELTALGLAPQMATQIMVLLGLGAAAARPDSTSPHLSI